MMDYQKFVLDNGLQVYVHEDPNTEMAVLNLLYKVGSRNEVPGKTGLAHYFEHLMFGGSEHVPSFDTAIERVGGECNAFTSTDITNYYISLPAINIETAFWLESDRMFALSLQERVIETQRNVVIEEYKQRYLNQPYGDAMHHLRALAFRQHPYRWPTIGFEIADIENFTEQDVRNFYQTHYRPDNAILVVAGDVSLSQVEKLSQKWFGDIPSGKLPILEPALEPAQTSIRHKTVYADVPTDSLYKAYHMAGRLDPGYLEADLVTDVLGFGRSSVLEQRLVKNTDVFANCRAYVLGNVDPSLLIISGRMEKGYTAEQAEELLDKELETFKASSISPKVLQKVKNQSEAMRSYEAVQLLNRAMRIAYYAHLGTPDLYETEYRRKLKIKGTDIIACANDILVPEKASVLYYKKGSASENEEELTIKEIKKGVA
ncbi:zinc protease [Lunatimonas lonarensis]|uniref:Zinc protease n=1 Tax=Lunatimonas lonarensis TaxID=1232681 RepID=R7ZM82_9BACT|nr:pitrilysin family protein [Lunatimonas lonarensis]EON75114.1 zinc protease [Lunatimonas lonarensis]